MIRPIIPYPELATVRAEDVPADYDPAALDALFTDLIDTAVAVNARGLAAPQIGVPLRACVVRDPGEPSVKPLRMVNPAVIRYDGDLKKEPEGCLSLSSCTVGVWRREACVVQYLDPDNELKVATLGVAGALARTVLHELSHLDGLTIADECGRYERSRLLERHALKQRRLAARGTP